MTSAMTFGCLILRSNRPKSCVINRMTPTHHHSNINDRSGCRTAEGLTELYDPQFQWVCFGEDARILAGEQAALTRGQHIARR